MTEKEKAVLALVDEHSTQSGGSYFLWTSEVLDFAAAIRDDALEEAALRLDDMTSVQDADYCAEAIRALKSGEKK